VFNLLGPVANPAGATHQLLGVFEDRRRATIAGVLARLGSKRAWVVHAEPCEGAPRGLDEISPSSTTRVTELCDDGSIVERAVHPRDAGMEPVSLDALRGGSAEDNAVIARAVLSGEKTPARIAVVLNAACALVVAGRANDLREARERVEATIDRGDAARTLERWRTVMTS
jgi:anthranilate phosphoribosyltransferase